MKKVLMVVATLIASAISAQAATFTPSMGLDLRLNATQSNDVQLFSEKKDVAVSDGQITVDFLVGTNLAISDTILGLDNFAGGAALAAGSYDSYLLHFDRTTNGTISSLTIDFGASIVGLIISNSGSQSLLNRTDATFGTAAFFDQDGSRRAESNDSFTLASATSLTINLVVGANFTDNIRVLTEVAPVPLPASLPLLLVGFGGLAIARRRR